MTSTITILCPSGIVMAADSRISYVDPGTGEPHELRDDYKKIYPLSNHVGISYWGLASINREPMLEILHQFDKEIVQAENNVNTVAKKLAEYLGGITPRIRTSMGMHIAGFIGEGDNNVPKLRHVFHESWHDAGEFTNEDCHTEYHQNGIKIRFPQSILCPTLFNGDNSIANCLFNFLPVIRGESIRTDLLTLNECLDLAELILSLAIQRLNFYFTRQEEKVFRSVGGKVYIGRIRSDEGFDWFKE